MCYEFWECSSWRWADVAVEDVYVSESAKTVIKAIDVQHGKSEGRNLRPSPVSFHASKSG